MRLTVAETIAVRSLSQPDRIAIEELQGGKTLTYGQLLPRIVALADAIRSTAEGPHGKMVGLFLPSAADHVLGYLACQWVGMAAVPVNSRLAEPEIEFQISDSGAKTILAAEPWLEMARKVGAKCGAVVIDADRIDTPESVERPVFGEHGYGERDCVVGYTSGTTGFPKGALYSNDHYLTAQMRWCWEYGLTADHVMLCPGPLFHLSYAGLAMGALMIGARVRIMQSFEPQLALDELSDHCTFAFLVPSMTTMIAEEWKKRGKPPVNAFRFMISSGAPGPLSMTVEAMEMFNNARIAEAYGWTEGGWVTFEVKEKETLLAHSVGWPTAGNEVGVFLEDGAPAPIGEPGEVGVKSVTHFSGYLGRPDATAESWKNGYVMSGDVGIWQADGRLCIVDRKKDMIISGGENVYTAEVERILVEHPGILEAAVVGLPDDKWGEMVTAMVVPREGAELTPEAVIGHCRENLAHYKAPRRVEIAAELPRNPMGKVQKFKIVESLTG
ncbi:MAG: class I adenylate-forming enzyme family protein [Minwuia sp.]|uniref:class I adenylate-forming enzyme family protein n=1 Tax=Minwuia sp. TaxID=2493630 RepID=UPI003A8C711E